MSVFNILGIAAAGLVSVVILYALYRHYFGKGVTMVNVSGLRPEQRHGYADPPTTPGRIVKAVFPLLLFFLGLMLYGNISKDWEVVRDLFKGLTVVGFFFGCVWVLAELVGHFVHKDKFNWSPILFCFGSAALWLFFAWPCRLASHSNSGRTRRTAVSQLIVTVMMAWSYAWNAVFNSGTYREEEKKWNTPTSSPPSSR